MLFGCLKDTYFAFLLIMLVDYINNLHKSALLLLLLIQCYNYILTFKFNIKALLLSLKLNRNFPKKFHQTLHNLLAPINDIYR